MQSKQKKYTGILSAENGQTFLLSKNGRRHFTDAAIWSGYIKHWTGRKLCGTLLPETDYETGKPVVLLWPSMPPEHEPYIELYYNERLVRYRISCLGHSAINVSGMVFNFSHLVNECEVISEAEYFYRPASGRFAPKPDEGFNIDDPEHPYLDKFGRQFMRTIYAARITGLDTHGISEALQSELHTIRNTPEEMHRPGRYRDFNILTRSCTTIIRDVLRHNGFPGIRGLFPRELFVSAVWNFMRLEKSGKLKVSVYTRPQLRVEEAPLSSMTPLVNPANIIRAWILRKRGIGL